MNDQKIAILVDSGTDVPAEICEQNPIYIAPLKVLYRDREFQDRVDITPQDVYDRLAEEIPKTSLPSSDALFALFDQIQADGYEKVLCITIFSALSGTFDMVRLAASQHPKLDCRVMDTKNIGIGAGMQAIYAARMAAENVPLDLICQRLEWSIAHTKVFFCVATLEYLRKGGRINRVAAAVGSLLNLKPVVSCDAEGAYYIASKVRGRAKSIAEAVSLAISSIKDSTRYVVAVAQGSAMEEARKVLDDLRRRLPECSEFLLTDVSPALGVHTGPGLIGVCVQQMI